jgi:integrase
MADAKTKDRKYNKNNRNKRRIGKRASAWSYSAGERGRNRVRAFEHDASGGIYLEWRAVDAETGGVRRERMALPGATRDQAKAEADRLAAAFAQAVPTGAAVPGHGRPAPAASQTGASDGTAPALTVGVLFDNYLREETPLKGASKQQHDRAAGEMFVRFLGRERLASTLSRRDWTKFIVDRGSGEIAPSARRRAQAGALCDGGDGPATVRGARKTASRGVRNRQIAYDLQFLNAVLNWAARSTDEEGRRLLAYNPLKGLRLPVEASPAQPLILDDEVAALVAKAGEVWPRFPFYLRLVYETGHRSSSVRLLEWGDVDLETRTIRWRAEVDKIDHEHETPMSDGAWELLDAAHHALGRPDAGLLFPSDRAPGQPINRKTIQQYWRTCERLAGVARVRGRGLHALRRLFATSLKAVPMPDLMALGGWKSAQTLTTCYLKPDHATSRAALANRGRLTARGLEPPAK